HPRDGVLYGREPLEGTAEARLAQRHHAALRRVAAEAVAVAPVGDHAAHRRVDPEYLVQRHAPGVADVAARLAAAPAVQHLPRGIWREEGGLLGVGAVRLFAGGADLPDEPLCGGDVHGGG